ncbi:cytochrome P450 [Fomitiporia mediterranea MF3/22]|uniref:cytochrome P450 n=1 Tax=Fomitiporia mediterranea (strain MF3/22) TaxID=694068 RepID=UPI00044072FE|nr:cytochrome P450 [Fomitiporia mediterranea MF3/22]EJD05381.1 cytochrome P450 [Fomitiporia mediterranea MF3/22]
MAPIIGAAGIACTLCLGLFVYLSKRAQAPSKQSRGHGLPLPPGPKPLPFLGNALDMPVKREWEAFAKWANEYGDIVHVSVFGQNFIFLNSAKVVNDLFDKRGSIYSDKPRLPLLTELLDFEWNFGFMPYGEEWRKYRRMFVGKFGASAAHIFNPIHERVSGLLLQRFLDTPEDFIDHLRLHAGQIIMMSTYGIFVDSRQHPYIQIAQAVMDSVSDAARAGAYLVDAFPILKKVPTWFPGAHYQRVAQGWAAEVRRLRFIPFLASKNQLADGKAPPFPSFVADELEENGYDEKDAELMIQDCAAVAYGAGSDTSVATLTAFVLAMVIHPEIQKKAQEELAAVVGTSRLPTFADRNDLPYISAIMKETIRWHTVAPQALPHTLREDDVYNGYHIPAGSIVIGNTWNITHDPALYPDPMEFKPERFINSEGKLDFSGATDPSKFAFGYGRRICAGWHFAENTIFITIALVLHCFNITNAKDKAGMPIPVSLNAGSGVISHPEPFPCSITPRSAQAEALIRQAAASAQFV